MRKFARRHRTAVLPRGAARDCGAGVAGDDEDPGATHRGRARPRHAEAATATEVSEFLVGLFKVSDPSEAG